jgi:transposase
MFRVEIYGRVRRAVLVEGRSQREVAREFGISRKTIQKMLRYAVPPGYQRAFRRHRTTCIGCWHLIPARVNLPSQDKRF